MRTFGKICSSVIDLAIESPDGCSNNEEDLRKPVMPRPLRHIIATLAISSLLIAGWLAATHRHFSHANGHHSGKIGMADTSRETDGSSIDAHDHLATCCHHDHGTMPDDSTPDANQVDHSCPICQFLSTLSYELPQTFSLPMVETVSTVTQIALPSTSSRELAIVSCRGPPAC